jgi:hypothetical protein
VLVHSVLWPLALNTYSGFQSVPETLRMTGRNYGLKGLRHVLLAHKKARKANPAGGKRGSASTLDRLGCTPVSSAHHVAHHALSAVQRPSSDRRFLKTR